MGAQRRAVRDLPRPQRRARPLARVPLLRHAGHRAQLALLYAQRHRVRDGEARSGLDLRGHRLLHPGSLGRRLPRGHDAGLPQLQRRRAAQRRQPSLHRRLHRLLEVAHLRLLPRGHRHVLAAFLGRSRRRRGAAAAPGDLRADRSRSAKRGHDGRERMDRRAARAARDAISGVPVDAREPARHLRRRPHAARAPRQLLRARQLHALPAAAAVLPQRARAARPAAPARRLRAVADHGDLGRGQRAQLRDAQLPADLPRPRVRQLLRPAARGDALAGDGRLPRHGQQQQDQPGSRHRSQRELRARDPAALLGRNLPAQPRRHAAARRLGQAALHLRARRDQGLLARLHRLDLSHRRGRPAAQQQPAQLPGRHARRWTPTTSSAPRCCWAG